MHKMKNNINEMIEQEFSKIAEECSNLYCSINYDIDNLDKNTIVEHILTSAEYKIKLLTDDYILHLNDRIKRQTDELSITNQNKFFDFRIDEKVRSTVDQHFSAKINDDKGLRRLNKKIAAALGSGATFLIGSSFLSSIGNGNLVVKGVSYLTLTGLSYIAYGKIHQFTNHSNRNSVRLFIDDLTRHLIAEAFTIMQRVEKEFFKEYNKFIASIT